MKKFTVLSVSAIVACAALSAYADSLLPQTTAAATTTPAVSMAGKTGTVKADRVNVRSRADKKSDVVTQVNKGDTVVVLDEMGEWVKIQAPEKAKCFVSSHLLKDGVCTTDNANVRSGPGTNFKDIGKLAKGEKVDVIKTVGTWSQIKPTEKCVVFIAAQFLDISTPLPPPPVLTSIESNPAPVITTVPVTTTPAVKAPEPKVTVQYLVKEGFFQTVEESGAPAKYELMTQDVGGRQYRMDYLDMSGVDKNLTRFAGKQVRVFGNERWREGDRYPVMTVDRIDMVW
jgi:SH3-like domain-containing protein